MSVRVRRTLGQTGGFFFLALLVGLVWRLQRLPTPGPSFDLPDGGRFQVAEIRWAANYTFHHLPGPDWRRFLVSLIPSGPLERLGWRVGSGCMSGTSSGGTNLFLATIVERLASGRSVDPKRLRVRDDAGREIVILPESRLVEDGEIVRLWRLPSLPGGSEQLELSFLYEYPEGFWAGTPPFVIRNPRAPLAKPAEASVKAASLPTLPAIASDGDFEVELSDARVCPWAENDPRFGLQLRFETRWHGHETTHWRPATCEIVDPVSGSNVLPGGPIGGATSNSTFWTYVSPWLNEPCRVRLEFTPDPAGGGQRGDPAAEESPEEVLTTQPVPIPAPNVEIHPGIVMRGQGLQLEIDAIETGRANSSRESEGRINDWNGEPGVLTLWVVLRGGAEGHRLRLLRAVDEQGRAASVQTIRWSASEYAFGVIPGEGAKTLRFSFTCPRSRFVEFEIVPRADVPASVGR